MANWTHFYLIRIEFLGFRFHGWQKQEKLKSVQGMVDKTFTFIFNHENFKTLGCGRTDAKVSADNFALELFTYQFHDVDVLLKSLNKNLPQDIRAKSVEVIDASFNIIQHAKVKEYHYSFSYGEKPHPFSAPFIVYFGEYLDIEKMKEAAKIFEGTHNFKRFVTKPSAKTVFEREIFFSLIEPNTKFKADFMPLNSYVFKVKSSGFLRYQVRLMMAALVDVGRGIWSLEDLKMSLENFNGPEIKHIAPSSGLVLHQVIF